MRRGRACSALGASVLQSVSAVRAQLSTRRASIKKTKSIGCVWRSSGAAALLYISSHDVRSPKVPPESRERREVRKAQRGYRQTFPHGGGVRPPHRLYPAGCRDAAATAVAVLALAHSLTSLDLR